MNQPDEFYIGWEARAAAGIGKTVRKAVFVVLTLACSSRSPSQFRNV